MSAAGRAATVGSFPVGPGGRRPGRAVKREDERLARSADHRYEHGGLLRESAVRTYGRDIPYGVAVLETLDLSPLIIGAARPKLIADRPGGIRFPVSPAAEQKAIAAQLSTKTAGLDARVDRVVAAIACLTGYCQALITAAGTGKIGVQGAA